MIRWLVGTSLRLRFLVLIVAAAVMFFGIGQLRSTSIDVLPEFSPPFVEIQTEALGLSAEEVEALITVPLEADLLAGVSFLQHISSRSVNSLSSIYLTFEPGTDIFRARQMVQERLTQAHALPNVSAPPVMVQPLSSASRFLMVGLASEELSLIELSVLARWTIVPRLMGVDGVANVALWGQRKRQLHVQVDPARLNSEDVSLMQVIRTTGNALWVSPLSFLNASYPGTGGWIDTPNQRLQVKHLSPISNPEDLAQVPIEGTPFALGDITEVVEDHQPLIGDAIVNGEPGLLLVVERFPWANTLDVTEKVEDALTVMRNGLPGVELDATLFRPASYIEQATSNLSTVLLIGLILLIVMLFVLFADWRSGLIAAVTIPASLLVAVFVLNTSGATLNMLVLTGLVIAIGAIVDNAVVDVENFSRRLRQRRQQGDSASTPQMMLESLRETRSPLFYAALIAVLAFVPIFVIPGETGAFFRPLALATMLAIGISMLVALTLTPALALVLFPNGAEPRRPLLARLLDGPLAGVVRKPGATGAAWILTALLVVVGIVGLTQLRVDSLVPDFRETDLLVQWDAAPGTSHPQMTRFATQAAGDIGAVPGVSKATAHVGRAVLGDQVVGMNSGQLWVRLEPDANYDEAVAGIREVIANYPGVDMRLSTYLEERTAPIRSGAIDAVTVRLFGPELDVLRSKADEIAGALSGIDGIVGSQVETFDEEAHLQVRVDVAAAQTHGLKPGDVRRAAAVLMAGIEVGSLFEQSKVFDVVVIGTPELRSSLSNFSSLLIDTPSGDLVQLSEVADITIVPTPNVIRRDGVSRRIDIEAIVSGRNLSAVAQDIEDRLERLDFELEYHTEVLGDFEQQSDAVTNFLLAAITAAIGIFLLQQASVKSWRVALLAFAALPLSLVGGIVVALLAGGTMGLGTLAGLAAVLVIAAGNGLLTINHYQNLELREGETFGPELVERGTRERAVPLLMSALALAPALLVLLFAGTIAGLEVLRPMAAVMLGGLVTTTAVALYILPAAYLRLRVAPEEEFDFSSPPMVGDAQPFGGP